MIQVPFYDKYINIFTQTNGVAMSSPFGPTLFNLYRTYVEHKIFNNFAKPITYVRYIGYIHVNEKPWPNEKKKKLSRETMPYTYGLNNINGIFYLDV